MVWDGSVQIGFRRIPYFMATSSLTVEYETVFLKSFYDLSILEASKPPHAIVRLPEDNQNHRPIFLLENRRHFALREAF